MAFLPSESKRYPARKEMASLQDISISAANNSLSAFEFRLMIGFSSRNAFTLPERELIDHAGLDSVVYIPIYLLGLKIIVSLAVLAFLVLLPVNWVGYTLERSEDLTFSDIDKLLISNVPEG
ncbi:hypothetical protein DITRI_Ditri11bG0096700 [Diplodiscus trichospermus]